MRVLVQELRGEALVWAAAHAAPQHVTSQLPTNEQGLGEAFDPIKHPHQAQAIRDAEQMSLERWVPWPSERWWARIRDDQMRAITAAWGSTRDEATLRCLVKHRFGAEADIPEHVMLESAKRALQAGPTSGSTIAIISTSPITTPASSHCPVQAHVSHGAQGQDQSVLATIKTQDACGAVLDYAAAKSQGYFSNEGQDPAYWASSVGAQHFLQMRQPTGGGVHWTRASTDPDVAYPLFEKLGVQVVRGNDMIFPHGNQNGDLSEPLWMACVGSGPKFYGPTELVAGLRCCLAYTLGPEIDVPVDLLAEMQAAPLTKTRLRL